MLGQPRHGNNLNRSYARTTAHVRTMHSGSSTATMTDMLKQVYDVAEIERIMIPQRRIC